MQNHKHFLTLILIVLLFALPACSPTPAAGGEPTPVAALPTTDSGNEQPPQTNTPNTGSGGGQDPQPSTPTNEPAGGVQTPSSGDGQAWSREQFGTAWDVSYPQNWTVNRAGINEGALQFQGPLGDQVYEVSLSFPIGLPAASLDAWVNEVLAALPEEQRTTAQVTETEAGGVPARIVQFKQGETTILQAYLDKSATQNRRLVVAQPAAGDNGDPAVMRSFLDRFLMEMRAPAEPVQ